MERVVRDLRLNQLIYHGHKWPADFPRRETEKAESLPLIIGRGNRKRSTAPPQRYLSVSWYRAALASAQFLYGYSDLLTTNSCTVKNIFYATIPSNSVWFGRS